MTAFGGGANVGGGAAGSVGRSRMTVDVGGGARDGRNGFGWNQISHDDQGLSRHDHAMHHFGRVSPEYGVYDNNYPSCNIEATEGDEFPCSPR